MRSYFDVLAAAAQEAEDAQLLLAYAVNEAKQVIGTPDILRAMRVVEKCKRERDRANARFLLLRGLNVSLVSTS